MAPREGKGLGNGSAAKGEGATPREGKGPTEEDPDGGGSQRRDTSEREGEGRIRVKPRWMGISRERKGPGDPEGWTLSTETGERQTDEGGLDRRTSGRDGKTCGETA